MLYDRMIKPEHLSVRVVYKDLLGGQTTGTIPSDIEVTHLPTGLMARCGTNRSQLKNKNICLSMLEWGLNEIGWKE